MGKNRADCWADMLDEMQKDRSGCHSPAIWEWLGTEGAGEICIQRLRLVHAVQLQENKNRSALRNTGGWEINILKCELCLAKHVY